jgi:hypothetical protein
MSLMLAMNVHAKELSRLFSQSFASLRQRPSHANVRSTTHHCTEVLWLQSTRVGGAEPRNL